MSVPTITGTLQVGQTLTALIGDIQTPVTYQWKSAGIPIPGATNSIYILLAADVGKTITVSVAAVSPPTAAVVMGVPVNTSPPAFTGTAQVGQTLIGTTFGTWTNNPTSYAVQWKRSGAVIPGATGTSYLLVAADIGSMITVSVVATNSGGSSSPGTSAASAAVIDIAPANSSVPTISGTAQVGQTLTATTGTWTHNPTSFTYQWKRASTPISGATASTYVPVTGDIGNTLAVSIVATNSGGSSPPATSAASAAVIDIAPANSSVPTISGTAQVGQTLTAATGTWTHNPTSFAYHWNRAGSVISGAMASTYVPVAADVGTALTVSVVATNSGGASAPATSSATSSVIDIVPTNLVLPTISGIAQVGQTLTAATGTWMNNPTSFTCQWKRAGAAILGATALTYLPVAADVGTALTVSVVATNSGGSSAPAVSAATSAVLPAASPVNTVVPTISGTPQVGQTLTATNGTWTNSPASFTYQWNRAGMPIGGATASTYVPVSADVGNILTVSVTATNGSGSSTPATSAATSPVMGAGQIIPPDRNFTWNPGMMSKGGIPVRTTIFTTISPIGGGADDSAAIQAAINSCPAGQVVKLSAGTFTFTGFNFLLLNKGITLRGAGAGQTIIHKVGGAVMATPTGGGNPGPTPGQAIVVGPALFGIVPGDKDKTNNITNANLTADGAQGSYSVTVASAAQFQPGMFVLLDEVSGAQWMPDFVAGDAAAGMQIWASSDYRVAWKKHNPHNVYDDFPAGSFPYQTGTFGDIWTRLDRPTSEIKEIASISGNTVTFTSPLTISYRVSHAAQLSRYGQDNAPSYPYVPHVTGAGIEGITFTNFDNGTITWNFAAYCWAKDVEQDTWLGGFQFENSFRVELRDFYSHRAAAPQTGGGAYAIIIENASSELLIENGISIQTDKVMVARAAGAGSVVAYNYMDMGFLGYNGNWIEVGLNASHLVGPHHILFEGNYGFNADSDNTHGNSIYNTYFRNYLPGIRRSFVNPYDGITYDDASQPGNGPRRAAGLMSYSYWMSFVGNVLGAPGQTGGWQYESNWNTGPAIWMLGTDSDFNQIPSQDTQIANLSFAGHVIRDGNYDFLTNSQRWHDTPGGFAVPNSMYLTSKPAFFGSNPWPWVDPTTGATYTLPAKARYDSGNPNGTTSDTTPPSVPTNLAGSAISSSQINLTWTASTDNVGVTAYKIFRNGVQVGTSATASYSDTGLTPSTTYTYTVSAYDAAGNNSAQSASISVTTPAGTPIPTVTISASPTSVASGGSSTLTWSSTNATSCTASGGWSGSKATSGSQTLTNLTTTSTYTLACTGAGGTATQSATVTVTGVIDESILPAIYQTTWDPGIPGGIPADNDRVRPASVWLPAGNPYNGYSVNPALTGTANAAAFSTAFQAAINSAGAAATPTSRRIVFLKAGSYFVNPQVNSGGQVGIVVKVDNVTIRGEGAQTTRIIANGQINDYGTVILFGHRTGTSDASFAVQNVTADALKGSKTIQVANASAYVVGDVITIDHVDGPASAVGSAQFNGGYLWTYDGQYFKRQPSYSWTGPGTGAQAFPSVTSLATANTAAQNVLPQWRSTVQETEITAISGNTLTIKDALNIDFPLSLSPQVWRTVPVNTNAVGVGTRWVGLENIGVAGGNNLWGFPGGNIALSYVAYGWVKSVDADGDRWSTDPVNHPGKYGYNIGLGRCYRCVVRDSYVHGSTDINPGGQAYGIVVGVGSSANLIENNISINNNKPIALNETGGGNVISYNYVDQSELWNSPGWLESGIDDNHANFTHNDLIEGNWASNIGSDSTHGNSGWHTHLRNYSNGNNSIDPKSANLRAVSVTAWTHNLAFIGNVLMGGNVYQVTPSSPNGNPIFQLGFYAGYPDNGGMDDGYAAAHVYRDGNWDNVSNAVVWVAGVRAIPQSFYLTSKPAFFGTYTWPWVDPTAATAATRVLTLPAKARFDAGTPFAS